MLLNDFSLVFVPVLILHPPNCFPFKKEEFVLTYKTIPTFGEVQFDPHWPFFENILVYVKHL